MGSTITKQHCWHDEKQETVNQSEGIYRAVSKKCCHCGNSIKRISVPRDPKWNHGEHVKGPMKWAWETVPDSTCVERETTRKGRDRETALAWTVAALIFALGALGIILIAGDFIG